jgi:hypothetical protein
MNGLQMMDQELTASFELLTRRRDLMRELADSLQQVQTAVVRSDLRGINGHTARQRELCEALRQLASQAFEPPDCRGSRPRKTWVRLPEGVVSLEVRQRWTRLTEELTEVEMQVSQLNQVYGALLKRAQRTLQIFLRVLASSANTYAPPKWEPAIPEPVIPGPALQAVSHV